MRLSSSVFSLRKRCFLLGSRIRLRLIFLALLMNCPEVVFCFESEEKRISGFGRPLPAEGREDLEGERGEEE